METILDRIAENARQRVERAKKAVPMGDIRALALGVPQSRSGSFAFEKALKDPDLSFICECKKASPSKGVIAQDYPYLQIAEDYRDAGASCISVLTEPRWFLGDDLHLKEIAAAVDIPCLRKDFTVDEYMIYEARLLGASAVLLICSLLDGETLSHYISICNTLGLSALVETHNEAEIKLALGAGARVIGVNNRDLRDFSVSMDNAVRLRELVPPEAVFVAESGVSTPEQVAALRTAGVDAVLVGEAMMRAENKSLALAKLKGAVL